MCRFAGSVSFLPFTSLAPVNTHLSATLRKTLLCNALPRRKIFSSSRSIYRVRQPGPSSTGAFASLSPELSRIEIRDSDDLGPQKRQFLSFAPERKYTYGCKIDLPGAFPPLRNSSFRVTNT